MSDFTMIALAAAIGLAASLGTWLWRTVARLSNQLRAARGLDGMHLEVVVDAP